jgi:hypothetical protein
MAAKKFTPTGYIPTSSVYIAPAQGGGSSAPSAFNVIYIGADGKPYFDPY